MTTYTVIIMESTSWNESRTFEELLPFYVTSQLSKEDRDYCEQYLHNNPSARDSLQWSCRIMDVVKSIGYDNDMTAAIEDLKLSIKNKKRQSNRFGM